MLADSGLLITFVAVGEGSAFTCLCIDEKSLWILNVRLLEQAVVLGAAPHRLRPDLFDCA